MCHWRRQILEGENDRTDYGNLSRQKKKTIAIITFRCNAAVRTNTIKIVWTFRRCPSRPYIYYIIMYIQTLQVPENLQTPQTSIGTPEVWTTTRRFRVVGTCVITITSGNLMITVITYIGIGLVIYVIKGGLREGEYVKCVSFIIFTLFIIARVRPYSLIDKLGMWIAECVLRLAAKIVKRPNTDDDNTKYVPTYNYIPIYLIFITTSVAMVKKPHFILTKHEYKFI